MSGTYWHGGRAYRAGFPLHPVRLTNTQADAVNLAAGADTQADILGTYPSAGHRVSLADFRDMMADITRQALEDIRRTKGD